MLFITTTCESFHKEGAEPGRYLQWWAGNIPDNFGYAL